MKQQHALIASMMLLLSATVPAEEPAKQSTWSYVQDTLSQTWDAKDYELYIPINAWHNRNYYSSEKIDQYNEQPWGLGIGKYRFDADGDWHALYTMAFSDSHHDIEPVAGYGFQKMWWPGEHLRLGAGYTVGVTLREDFHYLPIPVAAPLVSVEYQQLALQATYIPGGHGNGNILFSWLRWQLK